jgi:hypothetical protein
LASFIGDRPISSDALVGAGAPRLADRHHLRFCAAFEKGASVVEGHVRAAEFPFRANVRAPAFAGSRLRDGLCVRCDGNGARDDRAGEQCACRFH